MIKSIHYITIGGIIACLTLLLACQQIQRESAFATKLFSSYDPSGEDIFEGEPGSEAFYDFIQHLSDESVALSTANMQLFLPDSIIQQDYELHGIEISYTDARRLLYLEFNNAESSFSFPYLALYSKGGTALAFMRLKEATFNGYSSVQLIDEEVLELEYYDVYDEDGQHIEALTFEYFTIGSNDEFVQLGQAENVSEGREYPEASLRLLSKAELNQLSYAQLSMMKNEIYADHGQWFTTSPWDGHFEKQTWYIPRFDDVSDRISGLEAVNLETIAELQRAL